jgi:hypothetical protein
MAKLMVGTARSVGDGLFPLAGTLIAGILVTLTSILV